MLRKGLAKPIDGASIAVFRICFGLTLFVETIRYSSKGWYHYFYIYPKYFFTYPGFSWVTPVSEQGIYLCIFLLGLSSIFLALGILYRVAIATHFTVFLYFFLLDKTHYLNHFYLTLLLLGIMFFIPADNLWALSPNSKKGTVPRWCLSLLQIQIAIPYFYGGLAKLQGDWLAGEPMKVWLADAVQFPLIGRYFLEPWAAYFFSWGGAVFDLSFIPLLLWKRTRIAAFMVAILFHAVNARLFHIGIFPWLMIAASTLFLSENWPRKWMKLKSQPLSKEWGPISRFSLGIIGVYLALQLLIPLRHFLYPGWVLWTYEGKNFAWRMKEARIGSNLTYFYVNPVTNKPVILPFQNFLTKKQEYALRSEPEMVREFSHFLSERLSRRWGKKIPVHVNYYTSLNGRKPQRRIDPRIDLSSEHLSWGAAKWILPLDRELPESAELKDWKLETPG